MLDTEYTVSMDDVKGYVRTVPEGALVGIPQHNYDCLIGRAMQMKYPGKLGAVGYLNARVHMGLVAISVPSDVREAGNKFDALWEVWDEPEEYENEDEYPPITLAVLRERMPELF